MESARVFVASIFIGGGIVGLHYTAMASMRFQGMDHYSPALVTLSAVLAMLFALLSLWLTFLFRDGPRAWRLQKVASVALMGSAIWVMHYTGMASASYTESATPPDLSHAVRISSLSAAGIGAVALTVLTVALLTSTLDRLQKQSSLLRTAGAQLRALSASVESAREEEGIRIAREIHDQLGSALSSLRWELEEVDEVISETKDVAQLEGVRQKIEGMIGLTSRTLGDVRRIAAELRPFALDELGPIEAIEWQAQQFQARTGIICKFECAMENVDLNQEQTTAVFRIFQEALTNILRHAAATRVDISMKQEAGEFVLTISDNGRGIRDEEKSGSLGLLGMRERADIVGGKLDVWGMIGKGTTITLRIPVSRTVAV
jgi:signal transduction histidine kinase